MPVVTGTLSCAVTGRSRAAAIWNCSITVPLPADVASRIAISPAVAAASDPQHDTVCTNPEPVFIDVSDPAANPLENCCSTLKTLLVWSSPASKTFNSFNAIGAFREDPVTAPTAAAAITINVNKNPFNHSFHLSIFTASSIDKLWHKFFMA